MVHNCNECMYAKREKLNEDEVGYKLMCSMFFLKTSLGVSPRTTSFRCYPNMVIQNPSWCPLLPENYSKPKVYDITKKLETITGKPKETNPLIADKFEKIPAHTPWDEIEVGELYIIPKFKASARGTVRVIEKNDISIRIHDVYANGRESEYFQTIFKTEDEAKFIVKKIDY